jgi:hypothetical protein
MKPDLYTKAVLTVIALLATATSGCHSTQPDHTDALSQIKTLISNDDGSFKITKLVYVNGFQKDPTDYVVFTTFTRVFKVSSSTYEKSTADNPIVAFAERLVLSNLYGNFESGDSFDEACQFRFLRTENGWILQGYEGDAEVVNKHTDGTDALAAQRRLAEQQQLDAQAKQKAIDAAAANADADAETPPNAETPPTETPLSVQPQ